MTLKLIFQMACILRPECNFLNGYYRCLLPVDMVDVEVKVKTMQGIYMFLGGQNIEDHQVQPLEHKTPSLPLTFPKDENVFGTRGQAWSQTQAPTADPSVKNPAMTNPATTKHQCTSQK